MKESQQIEAQIEKLYSQSVGERALGNIDAAKAYAAKAEALRRKHNMPLPEAVERERRRLEFFYWLETILPDQEVTVDYVGGGMERTMPLKVVLTGLKSGDLVLKKVGNKAAQSAFNDFLGIDWRTAPKPARTTDPGKELLPPPLTNEQLGEIREQAKSGTVAAEVSHFTPHEVDDRGGPYAAESERRKSRPWWHGIFFD